MTVTYRDSLGYVSVEVNSGVTFYNGVAMFECGEEDYTVDMKNLVCIENGEN